MLYIPNVMEHPNIKTKDGYRLSKYIRLGGPNGTAMRLIGQDWLAGSFVWSRSLTQYKLANLQYHRDGGAWQVDIHVVAGCPVAKSHMEHLHNKWFHPISRAEWKKDNGQYV